MNPSVSEASWKEGLVLSCPMQYDDGMNITTTNRPPTYGTTTQTWEGYVRADEILPGDVLFPEGLVENTVCHGDNGYEIVMADGKTDFYLNDDMLYLERTVTVTISEA